MANLRTDEAIGVGAKQAEEANRGSKRSQVPPAPRTLAVPLISRLLPGFHRSPEAEVPVQAGCSTLGPGGYRNKIRLKPGHSALDWHELVSGKGKRQGLVVGLEKLLRNDAEELQKLNHPQSLMQLQSGVPPYVIRPLLRIDKKMLEKHSTIDDCWTVIKGKVYCLTYYFDFHPGGVNILLKNGAGRDGTKAFEKYHRWVSYDKLLETCLVGVFVE